MFSYGLWEGVGAIQLLNNICVTKNIFLGEAFKLEKDDPVFKIFSPCPSLPSVATDPDRKQFQCLNISLYNKTGPFF